MHYRIMHTGHDKMEQGTTAQKATAIAIARWLSLKSPSSLVAVWRVTRKDKNGRTVALLQNGAFLTPVFRKV